MLVSRIQLVHISCVLQEWLSYLAFALLKLMKENDITGRDLAVLSESKMEHGFVLLPCGLEKGTVVHCESAHWCFSEVLALYWGLIVSQPGLLVLLPLLNRLPPILCQRPSYPCLSDLTKYSYQKSDWGDSWTDKMAATAEAGTPQFESPVPMQKAKRGRMHL